MDPRMDTGMVIDEGKRKKYDIEQVLNPLQVLWIMDKLLSCEMAWISGHSLAQTVYTCIYFHHVPTLMDLPPPPLNTADIDSVIQCVLKAYILASVKCCQHIWKEMISGNIFEEEDFTTNLFGLSLYDQLSDMDAFNDLSLALRILKTYIEGNEISDELKNNLLAIYERLSLRKSFLQALIYFEQPRCSHIHQVKKSLNEIMALLDNNSNKTKDPAITILGSLDSGVEIEGAFDPNINRKLTTQSPPRSVSLPSSQKTYDDFLKLIQRLESICNIIKFPSVTSLMVKKENNSIINHR
ncbi:Mak10 subunit, NatC N-terminal acetyltransferase-domain-containing protein [Cunninghamella echinulata]|nr:Mak10 subunit, NatC N-terminal acetyltransferase-domain-containing protein [Cunninghamella echinulata]